jgi:hypothetical protein
MEAVPSGMMGRQKRERKHSPPEKKISTRITGK